MLALWFLSQTGSQVIASLEMPTCAHRLVMGGQTASRRKSQEKAISVQPRRTNPSKNDTETNLRQLALGGQTVKNLRQLGVKSGVMQSSHETLGQIFVWAVNHHLLDLVRNHFSRFSKQEKCLELCLNVKYFC